MPEFECRKCFPTKVPDNWTPERKSEIAILIREMGPIRAISRFKSNEITLTDAKGIALHITLRKGACHKCQTQLIEYEGQCPKCKRLNLDW